MWQSLPNEVLEHVCGFLLNDGISVGRLSVCSRGLYQHIAKDSPDLWRRLIVYRWPTTSTATAITSCSSGHSINGANNSNSNNHNAAATTVAMPNESSANEDPRRAYWRRYAMDQRARDILDQMTLDLKESLQLPEVDDDNAGVTPLRLDGNPHVGQAWDHLLWKDLLALGGDVVDVLREQAQLGLSLWTTTTVTSTTRNAPAASVASSVGFDDRLRSFLAARSLQTIQFAECLFEWKTIQELSQDDDAEHRDTAVRVVDPASNALLLERYALLVNDIQQPPDQLILRRREDGTVRQSVLRRLDRLAEACQHQIRSREQQDTVTLHNGIRPQGTSLGILEKIQIINHHLFQQEGFQGNSDDYYNYRNSLLESVLDSKKGIPITLTILYTCICRRLGLDVYLVGLPGHVVLGFTTNNNADDDNDDNCPDEEVQFVDVFRQGELLDVQDCRRISLSYNVPFLDKYVEPLPAHQVLQRMLNNLANCHFHGLATGTEPFQSDLFFHQRALASIHRQPPAIAAPLVDRVTQDLPLTLSPDLLRFYGLLSPSDLVQPPLQEQGDGTTASTGTLLG